MKLLSFFLLACIFATASGFRPLAPLNARKVQHISRTVIQMSDSEPSVELVPLDKENISNAATATGGILGLVLGGPVFAALLAALTNYVVKKEGDAGEGLRGVGKTVVESYNYLNKLNAKYGISSKVGDSVNKAVSSVDADPETLEKVKTTYSSTTSKLDELNKEYDLVGKGKQVLAAAGNLSDAALEKLAELNAKYDFVETTKKAATGALSEAKKATGAEPAVTPKE